METVKHVVPCAFRSASEVLWKDRSSNFLVNMKCTLQIYNKIYEDKLVRNVLSDGAMFFNPLETDSTPLYGWWFKTSLYQRNFSTFSRSEQNFPSLLIVVKGSWTNDWILSK